MNCRHFGRCGSCSSYDLEYEEALNIKKIRVLELIGSYIGNELEVFKSPNSAHRARAEFKIWHKEGIAHYAMSNIDKNGVELLSQCPKVIEPISDIWEELLKYINSVEILKHKLFSLEYLGSLNGELLVTLIYHKKLDSSWEISAKELQDKFNISLIGRARKQKIVLDKGYIEETLDIDSITYRYRYYEGGFTQPNPYINKEMISWAKECIKDNGDDFLEAYCGLGNFTIVLSKYFKKVLATEISSNSIKAAKENCILNNINNIEFVRLNAEETASALNKDREFRRLKDIELDDYNFSTILVDPPRAGLDESSLKLAQKFKYIVYISCNPTTLARDLEELNKTHRVIKSAMFDQFPYTTHIESGVYLVRRDNEK